MFNKLKRRIKEAGYNIVAKGIAQWYENNEVFLQEKASVSNLDYIYNKEKESVLKRAYDWHIWTKDFFINDLIKNKEDFEGIYSMMADDESKKVFDWLIAYRSLMPIFGDTGLWDTFAPCLLYNLLPCTTSVSDFKETFPIAVRNKENYCLHMDDLSIWHTFILEQYRYDDLFQIKEGFVVFDLGGYKGDTALYFSKFIGDTGKIFSFEVENYNVDSMKTNFEHFNINNVEIVEKVVSDVIGVVSFEGWGAAGYVAIDKGRVKVESTTIDDFVSLRQDITNLDIIKMDIEGSELAALKGARETLKKFKPILLIAVYHWDRDGIYGYGDFIPVCKYMNEMYGGDYSFYLRHKNCGRGETLLVCVSKK